MPWLAGSKGVSTKSTINIFSDDCSKANKNLMINLKTSPPNFPRDKLQNLPNSRGVTCTSKVILEKFIMTALNHALGCEEYSGKTGLKRPIKI